MQIRGQVTLASVPKRSSDNQAKLLLNGQERARIHAMKRTLCISSHLEWGVETHPGKDGGECGWSLNVIERKSLHGAGRR